jgi:hypothetical protein
MTTNIDDKVVEAILGPELTRKLDDYIVHMHQPLLFRHEGPCMGALIRPLARSSFSSRLLIWSS